MIVDRAIYEDGHRRVCGDLSDELDALRAGDDPTAFLWIGLKDPTQAEFDEVNDELQLHPLAVEDAVKGRQRAKVELYDDTVFVVLKPLRYIDRTSDIETGEVMVFVGDRFVVTVRRGELTPLTGIRKELEADAEALRHGPLGVLHRVLDRVVDGYVEIDGEVETDLDELETAVFSDVRTDTGSIYRLKREVLEFRRAAMPLAEPLKMLWSSPRSPVPEGELRLLMRDVSDHLQGVIDHVESYDDLLSGILSAHLAQVSVQQNDDMRRISAWVAIAALPTMIAGVYGMNFEYMPELSASIDVGGSEFRYGYFVVLLVMAGACTVLYRAFKRSGWL
ncbi:magnesium and cobalt transport protein CorA [Phycicoccus sonneratiae]|uniref:Magnesium and cobalt transport protein CorA n=1 Tax=Phycicoccus sonneratiae TaxID=2807628 RepID=A0ABS2CIA6_9MICO|nr:magnesium and cobalt transport protein CorA [Phycicoccus sonneraticus]MBM6399605.1 magnesium and cobalt transport protein CorA [Phycicoccus sonneraticus]